MTERGAFFRANFAFLQPLVFPGVKIFTSAQKSIDENHFIRISSKKKKKVIMDGLLCMLSASFYFKKELVELVEFTYSFPFIQFFSFSCRSLTIDKEKNH